MAMESLKSLAAHPLPHIGDKFLAQAPTVSRKEPGA